MNSWLGLSLGNDVCLIGMYHVLPLESTTVQLSWSPCVPGALMAKLGLPPVNGHLWGPVKASFLQAIFVLSLNILF